MKHDSFFLKHPVFTVEEFSNYLASRTELGARTVESLLTHFQKAGRVSRVRRGLYATVPPGASARTHPIDPFLVAARLTPDSVLSHHTALQYHGRAYSMQERFTYSTAHPQPPFEFRSQLFKGTKFPQALLRAGEEYFGVLRSERAGMDLRVTSLERTLVDVLDRPDLSGSWEEIWRSLESIEFFDLDKVVAYALLLKNATTGSKVGFFLEQHRETFMVEERHLKPLREQRPRQPHYLDRGKRESGVLVSGWNLVVPKAVRQRTWGEVL
jgi:predicted transcriptional regulator of viral defense system